MRVSTNRAWVVVDLGNLIANARAVQAAAGGVPLLPVVKADAYGLGAVRVARALERLNPWGFAVATLVEGIELREAGISRPILVFTPASLEQLPPFAEFDLRAVLDDPDIALKWSRPFHLEVDTGMGRCGVQWDEKDTLRRFDGAAVEGAFTHFYAADEGEALVQVQWERFKAAIGWLGRRPSLIHAPNSAGAWRLRERVDLVRPGIFLYGGEHAPDLPRPRPVISVRAPVVSVRRVPAGATVSYGGEWAAPRETTVATLGIGYADGLARLVAGKAHVLVHGRRRPVVGRVTMDFIMIDAGDDAVRVGDVATVVGREGDEEITIDQMAAWSQTIGYEPLTRLKTRMSREYIGE
ncbi:MAG: alanine racemase [Gemmatimonadales bacterium]